MRHRKQKTVIKPRSSLQNPWPLRCQLKSQGGAENREARSPRWGQGPATPRLARSAQQEDGSATSGAGLSPPSFCPVGSGSADEERTAAREVAAGLAGLPSRSRRRRPRSPGRPESKAAVWVSARRAPPGAPGSCPRCPGNGPGGAVVMDLEEAVREPGALGARRRGGRGVRRREAAGGRQAAVGAAAGRGRAAARLRGGEREGAGGPGARLACLAPGGCG